MTANHIAAIHVLKAKLRLTDEDYRALLKHLTGKGSSKDCTPAQQRQVRDHLRLGVLVRLVLQQVAAAPGPVQRIATVEHQAFATGGDHAGQFGIQFGGRAEAALRDHR